MKLGSSLYVGLCVGMLFGFSTQIARADGPSLVSELPTQTFFPRGFDDNDNSQIVIESWLQDTCHKIGPTVVKINAASKIALIENQVYVYPGHICMDVAVKYAKSIDLGILKAADYTVFFKGRDGSWNGLGTLNVARAANPGSPFGPDDLLYAPVSEAFMENPQDPLNRTLVIRGEFPNTCMALQDVRVTPTDNVVVILPISAFTTGNCQKTAVPFEYRVDLRSVPAGHQLLHIRSMYGKSVNTIVDLK